MNISLVCIKLQYFKHLHTKRCVCKVAKLQSCKVGKVLKGWKVKIIEVKVSKNPEKVITLTH